MLREINANEVDRIKPLIEEINIYHNEVSNNFKGTYPRHELVKKLESFKSDINSGLSKIFIIEENDELIGVIKINMDIDGSYGLIDFFKVLDKYRGKGYGKQLIEHVLKVFKDNNLNRVEVYTIDGNPAVDFYEKFGFKMQTHIMELKDE